MTDTVEVENTQPEPMPTVTKKDPKRVEQGKRLAMISKQAKERKMREKLLHEQKSSYMSYATTYVFPGIAVLSSCTLFYLWLTSPKTKQAESLDTNNNNNNNVQDRVDTPPKNPVVSNLESPKGFESFEW